MVKRDIHPSTLVCWVFDTLAIVAAFFISMLLRYGNEMSARMEDMSVLLIYSIFGYTLIFLWEGDAQDFWYKGKFKAFLSIVKKAFYLMVFLVIVLFFTKVAGDFSRAVIFLETAITVPVMYLFRSLLKNYMTTSRRKGNGSLRLLIITTPDKAPEIVKNFKDKRMWRYYIGGVVLCPEQESGFGPSNQCASMPRMVDGVPVVCDLRHVYGYCVRNVVDEVFVALPNLQNADEMVSKFSEMGVVTHFDLPLADRNDQVAMRMSNLLGNYFALSFYPNYLNGRMVIIKRVTDIIGSVIGLILTGIITVFLAPILLHESKGPLIFVQERAGKQGRIFKMYKFRSMYADAEEHKGELREENEMNGLMFKVENDPRVTKVGRFIRRTSLDELPQFFNVLKGDMSLVGTRPPTLDEYREYKGSYKRRLSMTPGMTGLWQVSGRSKITDFEEVVKLDLEYIDNWSFGLDLKIIFKTIGLAFSKKGGAV